MRIIDNLDEMTEMARGWSTSGPVGLILVSGSIHEGHQALIQAAYETSEVCVVAVLDKENLFSAHPHTTHTISEQDIRILQQSHTDILFIPSIAQLYPSGFANYVMPTGPIADCLTRTKYVIDNPDKLPKFATTMLKLFQLVRPDVIYFGQKDAMEIAIIRQLIDDFNIDMTIHIHPTIRDADGVAVSNRNQHLTAEQRRAAPLLYQALLNAKMLVVAGERRATQIEKAIASCITQNPHITLEYIIICHPKSFIHHPKVIPGTLIIVGMRIGNIQLVDNIQFTTAGEWFI